MTPDVRVLRGEPDAVERVRAVLGPRTELKLTEAHEMRYHWVKGHADNEYNNRCDALAVAEREKFA